MDFLAARLAALEGQGLLRREETPGGLDVSSNDYLGYARSPVSRATLLACEGLRTGSGASRLIFGTTPEHLTLEREVADWVGLDAALLFSSGYAANVGLLQALCEPGDLIVSDELNHASIIDGCRLAKSEVRVVRHRKVSAVAQALETPRTGRSWVVTETYFSMDGDLAPIAELRALCNRAGAGLIVDEAHALGVFGPSGSGICRAAGVVPDALVGTLGKAVGVQGAFVAGSATLRQWLWNRARSLVFSTAPTPLTLHVAHLNVKRARLADSERLSLFERADQLRGLLREAGLEVGPDSVGPIVPLRIGDNERTVQVARALRELGLRAQAIRPPTVPAGTARLRLTVSTCLSDADIEHVAECVIRACTAS